MKKQKIEFSGVAHFSPSRTTTKNKALLFFLNTKQNSNGGWFSSEKKKKRINFLEKLSLSRKCQISLYLFFFYQIGNRCSRLKEGTRPGEAPSNAKSRLDKKLFRACKDASFYNVATPFHAIPNVKAFFFSFHFTLTHTQLPPSPAE